jgi:hypothetical protein
VLILLSRILQRLLGLDVVLAGIIRRLDGIDAKLVLIEKSNEALLQNGIAQNVVLAALDVRLEAVTLLLHEIRDSVVAPPASRLALSAISVTGEFIESGETYMPKLHTGDSYTLQVEPKNAAGNPAQIDGSPAWSASEGAPVSLTVSENGLSCKVTATEAAGDALVPYVITAEADADLGAGVRKIIAAGSGFVIPPGIEATILELVEGPVTPAA